MKNAILIVCLAVVVVAYSGPVLGEDVLFGDPDLETAVRNELGILPPTPVTDTDMLTLGALSASTANIDSLTGLEYGLNLTSLGLVRNQISDITPVSVKGEVIL